MRSQGKLLPEKLVRQADRIITYWSRNPQKRKAPVGTSTGWENLDCNWWFAGGSGGHVQEASGDPAFQNLPAFMSLAPGGLADSHSEYWRKTQPGKRK